MMTRSARMVIPQHSLHDTATARRRSCRWKRPAALLAAVSLAVAGCDLSDSTFRVAGRAPSASPPPALYTYRYPSQPPVVSVPDIKSFVGRYTRRHNVVLLDVWAGWSRRCREEIADLARLQSDRPGEDVQVISCNLDPAEQWSSRTVPQLQGAGANFPCLVVRPDERAAMRQWLGPNWSYDLPARFLIDRDGHVAAQLLSDVTIAQVTDEARRLASGSSGKVRFARHDDDAPSLRLKLIDCRNGRWQSIPEIFSDSVSADRFASQAVQWLAAKVDRAANPRIAVAPFAPTSNRKQPSTLGIDTAKRIVAGLRDRGYFDLVGPVRTGHLIDDAGFSTLAIDYAPALIKGRLNVDYLLIGWLRVGNGHARPVPALAVGGDDDSPGGDEAFEHRRPERIEP
ncbi:MAG: TlpA disulfide reductase family protein [Phycisphaerae bacterium]